MLQDSRQAGAYSQDKIEAAAAIAAGELSVYIGEAVPLRDYLVSVGVFAEALGLADLQRLVARF